MKEKYNIIKISVGQMMYITSEYNFFLEKLSKQFKLDINDQLELEKNYEITNDIYSIETYIKIISKLENIIKENYDDNLIIMARNIFYDIANKVFYDENGVTSTYIENQNLIGPLFKNKSVCEGYSKCFLQILSLIGIESVIVSGGSGGKEEDGHVWTQVRIGENWYNADITAQSYCLHNNIEADKFLVDDDSCLYKSTSLFAHKCNNKFKLDIIKKNK